MVDARRLRVLLVEDSEDDAALLVRELQRVGYEAACTRVDTAQAMRSALETQEWDLVIADYNMPLFSAPAALALLQGTGLDLPFIIVSGSVGEEVVVEAMKAGAHDYLLKGNLKRLIPALQRELQQAEQRRARRKAEEQYRELVDFAPIGIYRSTREGNFVSVNAAYARMLGYDSPEDVLRLDLRRDIYFDNADRERMISNIEQKGGAAAGEVRLKRRDGSPIWVRQEAREVRGSSGEVEFFEDFVSDVHKQKRAEEALRQSEERFRRSFAASPIGMSLSEARAGLLIDVNESFARMLGYEREELIGRTSFDLGLWVDLTNREQVDQMINASVPVREREVRLRTKSGEVRYFFGSIEPLQVGEEQIYLSVFQDTTERKRAEQALRQSKERLRLILDTAHEAFVAMDAEGRIVDWNPQAEKTFGWASQEAMGRKMAETIIPERYREAHARGLTRFLETGVGPVLSKWFEIAAIDRDGREFPIELMISPMRLGEGYLFNAFLHDIGERKAAERALRASEERYRFLFESNPQPMWVFDDETLAFLAVNEAACRHYGYSREEFLGMTIRDIRPAEDVPVLLRQLETEPRRYQESGVWRHRRKNGSVIQVETTSNPLVFDGRAARLVLAADVTERRSLEEQLRQSQKMEAIGQLAGGVAHDFNNLLTAILGYADLLTGRVEGNDMQEAVTEIIKAGERAAALTRQLLAFSRKQVLAPEVLDVNRLITNLEKMLRRLIGEHVELVTRLAPRLGQVRADAGQIEQVIMNLIVNARDAMPRGGRLVIDTAEMDLDDAYAREHVSVRPGRYVMIAVSDSGVGMDAETKARIFEPFFTTKETGTGLGLATVYGIVKQSGGNIWVYSESGKGTTFKIYLPQLEGVEKRAAPKREVVDPLTVAGTETILLVEDEEAVRSLTRRVLERHGYTLLVAKGGAEALELARSHASSIHLLLSDLVMPGMGGPELAAQLTVLRPDIRVLFMSGYTDDAVIRNGLINQTTAFLQKPFTPDGLARKVRDTLS